MRVFVTGATGLVGSRLVDALVARGDTVLAASRDPKKLPAQEGVERVRWPGGDLDLSDVDVAVHLAGASIGGGRWTDRYMQELRDSRIDTTQALVGALPPSAALVAASAVGIYGRDPTGPCSEERSPGDDFLARLCIDWEAAARRHPGRNVQLRFGHVLAAHEGLLARLEPLHRFWVAGAIPPGDQHLPWIHADDLTRVLLWAIDGDAAGPVNAVAANTTAGGLHKALCTRLGGFGWLKVPRPALRIVLGRFAAYLTGGQEVVPARLHGAGFEPAFRNLEAALDDLYAS